jgi:hypothetical protein
MSQLKTSTAVFSNKFPAATAAVKVAANFKFSIVVMIKNKFSRNVKLGNFLPG